MENNIEKSITICIPITLICDTPNDTELGGKIRQIYWDSEK